MATICFPENSDDPVQSNLINTIILNQLHHMKYSRLILLAIGCFVGQITFAQTTFGAGAGAGGNNTDSYFGWLAGNINTALYNTFIGGESGRVNTTGRSNTFLGYASGRLNTTGRYNTFLGERAGFNNINGIGNAYLGYQAGFSGTTARYNAIIGSQSGYAITTGVGNTMVGRSSGRLTTGGQYNVYLGHFAGYRGTTAGLNVALGSFAGFQNVTGLRNVFLGPYAGYNETGSDKLYIENTSATTPLIYGDFAVEAVGINTKNVVDGDTLYTLSVNGIVRANEIHVYTGWADYVFEDDYKLRTLQEVDAFIRKNKHLPDIPSAKVVEKDGIFVGEMNATLLRKIEELTLYMIASDKAMKVLQKKVEALEKENKTLKTKSQK